MRETEAADRSGPAPRVPTWPWYWRRRRGFVGAMVEGVMWTTVVSGAFKILAAVLGWLNGWLV